MFQNISAHPKKMKKGAVVKIGAEAQDYEKSAENFIRSLSLLYAGGVIGKVKYEQGRSVLVMKHTGKTTKKGNHSKQRITFGFGIPIPRPLAYKDLMHKIAEIDIEEAISVRDTICATLSPEQKIAGAQRFINNHTWEKTRQIRPRIWVQKSG